VNIQPRRLPLLSLIPLLLFAVALGAVGARAAEQAPGAGILTLSDSEKMHKKMVDSGAVYPDQRVQDYVNRIGQALAANSSRPNVDYVFTVLDSENINAFALPDGHIYVNRGLMAYLDNEAELAGVLGHEIGHVTEYHALRQKTAHTAKSVAAWLAGVTTGSADLYDALNTGGTALVRGYGRDHELEADSVGAVLLHKTGYDPDILLEVIGVLKDQEQYNRMMAKKTGKKFQGYHGLFASHPRNDSRLQQVVRTASELEERPPALIEPEEFRAIISGLAYGKSSKPPEREENRFYHNKLGFTFAHPEGWTVKSGSRAIVTRPGDDSSRITLTIKRKDPNINDRQALSQHLEAARLFEPAAIEQDRMTGLMGVSPAGDGKNSRRLAVINMGRIAYLFEGEVRDEADFRAEDGKFLALIESFRPMEKKERQGAKPQELVYIQAQPGDTYASLAKKGKLRDGENQLRLLNGHYPRGKPHAGDWIKIVKQGER
jgi:predicted Zn-dependent protease